MINCFPYPVILTMWVIIIRGDRMREGVKKKRGNRRKKTIQN